jgi:hypothetical protein
VGYRTDEIANAVQLLQIRATEEQIEMDSRTHVQRQPMIEMQSQSLSIAARADARETATDIAHSENNIMQWMTYLPEDCIRTMVLMGWDINT